MPISGLIAFQAYENVLMEPVVYAYFLLVSISGIEECADGDCPLCLFQAC